MSIRLIDRTDSESKQGTASEKYEPFRVLLNARGKYK
jgi:hypothetical protein